MRTKFALSLCLLFSLSGCAKDPSNPSVIEDSGQDPDLCDTLLSGVPWGEISDFDPTFEASLNAIDFDALPKSFDISGLLPMPSRFLQRSLETPSTEMRHWPQDTWVES
jgi:hypothetical protein